MRRNQVVAIDFSVQRKKLAFAKVRSLGLTCLLHYLLRLAIIPRARGTQRRFSRARAARFRVWGEGGGGLERQTSEDESTGGGGFGDMLPRNFLILTPLKCREMHSKLINEKRYRLTKWYSPLKN